MTLSLWSALLIEEVFADREDEGRPVSTIDAGAPLLARVLARGNVHVTEAAALQLFVSAFPPRWRMVRWFNGVEDPGDAIPAFLILCCVAASEATGSEANDYRERIREMMGWDDIAMDCSALPSLWAHLERSLAAAPPERRLRRLVLPDPRFRTQIGHAIELTFPSRQDGRRLKHDLDEGGLADPRHPVAVMRWVGARQSRFSTAFQQTFSDFVAEWRAGARALTDHRFWSGWLVVVDSWRPILTQEPFHIVSDAWGAYQIVTPEGDATTLSQVERDAPSGLKQQLTAGSPVFLREIHWGEWGWVGHGRRAAQGARAAIIREKSHSGSLLAQLDLATVSGAPGWSLTNSIDLLPGTAARTSIGDDELVDVRFGGVPRIDGGRLARPSVPIVMSTTGPVASVTLAGEMAEMLKVRRRGPQEWVILPDVPVSGEVKVELETGEDTLRRVLSLRASSTAPNWSRELPSRFVRDEEPTPPWSATLRERSVAGPVPDREARGAGPASQALLDLVEYLAARPAVMPLGGLLDLLQTLPGVERVGRWAVVRALLEAGLIDPLRVRGWRGGAVIPRAPRVVLIPTASGMSLRLDGVVNEVLGSRLRGLAAKLGLELVAVEGFGDWAVSTLTVRGDAPALKQLAAELDLTCQYIAPDLAGHVRPGATPNADGANHGSRQLILEKQLEPLAARGVRLVFCRRQAEDAPPVWLVEREGCEPRYWTHRHLALLDACALAGIEVAAFEPEGLKLMVEGAFLPLQAARWIRLVSGAASGPTEGGYVYASTAWLEPQLREFLGLRAKQPRVAPRHVPMRGQGVASARGGVVDILPSWRWARERRGVVR